MKKRLVQILSCAFALSIIIGPVYAAADASPLITATYVSATPIGNGKVSFDFFILATNYMEDLGASVVTIWSESDGYLATFRYTDYGYEDMMGHDCIHYDSDVIFPGAPGESYYAVITFYASDGEISDTFTQTTNTAIAR